MDSFRQIILSNDLLSYVESVSVRENPTLKQLRVETYDDKQQYMQSSPEQVNFLVFIAKLINAKRIIEIGVYKGYTTLALALNTADEAKIYALEKNLEWLNIASSYWEKARVNNKINVLSGDALVNLNYLKDNTDNSSLFDMVYIDADKENYDKYYEISLSLVKHGGIIIVDNTLWHGKVVNSSINDKKTLSIRAFNSKLKDDQRVDISLLTIRDGVSIIRKR